MKILVADDDAIILKLLTRILTQAGQTVIPVSDGVSACAAAEAEHLDLAIVDLLLPKRDGYAVLMHLRSRTATRDLPIFLLSSELREEHEATALALGAQGLLSKPMKMEDLKGAIRLASEVCAKGGARS